MIIRLGERRAGGGDVVDLLLECHGRIRRFTEVARRLGAAGADPAEQVREAAAQVRRYFREALPLHVADEDETIAPALAGRDPGVDAALAAMGAEHVEHGPALERVVELCGAVAQDPRAISELGAELAVAAAALDALFEPHLAVEERTIFPAIAALPAPEREALLAAVRARRTDSRGFTPEA